MFHYALGNESKKSKRERERENERKKSYAVSPFLQYAAPSDRIMNVKCWKQGMWCAAHERQQQKPHKKQTHSGWIFCLTFQA